MRSLAQLRDLEIRAQVCESLRQCASGNEAQVWLAERGLLPKLQELAATNSAALLQLESTKTPIVAILNDVNLIHYGLLAGANAEVMEQLLSAVDSPQARRYFPQSGIWRSYASAIVAFVRLMPFAGPSPKPKGYEKFFSPYIAYMSTVNQEVREAARLDMARSFIQRNADRRFKDWYGLDGDGEKPVNWDFRAFTIGLVN